MSGSYFILFHSRLFGFNGIFAFGIIIATPWQRYSKSGRTPSLGEHKVRPYGAFFMLDNFTIRFIPPCIGRWVSTMTRTVVVFFMGESLATFQLN